MQALQIPALIALVLMTAGAHAQAGIVSVDRTHPGWIGTLSPGLDEESLLLLRARVEAVQRSQADIVARQSKIRDRMAKRGNSLLHYVSLEQGTAAELQTALDRLDHEQARDRRGKMRFSGVARSLGPTPRDIAIMRALDTASTTSLTSAGRAVVELRQNLTKVRQAQSRDQNSLTALARLHNRSGHLLTDLRRRENDLRLIVTEVLRRAHGAPDPEELNLAAHVSYPETIGNHDGRLSAQSGDGSSRAAQASSADRGGAQTIAASNMPESIFVGRQSPPDQDHAQWRPEDGLFMPIEGRLVDWTPSEIEPPFDRGILVETENGSIVRASKNGQIVFAARFRDLGPILIIDHGNEYHTVLAGLDRLAVTDGESVEVGQTLGMLPVSRQRKPRLYVEVRHRGAPIALLPWLAAREDKVRG